MERRKRKALAFLTLAIMAGATQGQEQGFLPTAYNTVFGQDSLLRGVKNVMGGVLAADGIHKNCMQKALCNEFADEVVEFDERVDPVKRTIVYVPRVIKPRGKLR